MSIEPTPGNGGSAIKARNRGLRKDAREYLRRVADVSQDMQGVAENNQAYVSDHAADCVHRENIQGVVVVEEELELGRKIANSSA